MGAKKQLIYDIIVLEERINRCYDSDHQPIDEIRKLQKRQINAIDDYHKAKNKEEAGQRYEDAVKYINCDVDDDSKWEIAPNPFKIARLAAYGKDGER